MKRSIYKVLQSVAVAAVLFGFAACEYGENEIKYTYTTVYFPNQDWKRNVIVGEGLEIGVGVTLTGVIDNTKRRIVNYKVDATALLDEEGYSLFPEKTLLPEEYYTMGHRSQIVIPKGNTAGYLSVKIDSTKFLADPKALTGEYVLPIRITNSKPDVDEIFPAKNFIRISISYLAKQFGNYHYRGEVFKYIGNVLFESYIYSHIPSENNSIRFLETVGPTTFRMKADSKNVNDPLHGISFLIDMPVYGTEVTILPDPDAPSDIRTTGDCFYNPKTRTFHLEYAWTADEDQDNAKCFVVEDLTFRNRIYDDQGNDICVNEWR
jgi:hypothetical protein